MKINLFDSVEIIKSEINKAKDYTFTLLAKPLAAYTSTTVCIWLDQFQYKVLLY